jgi:hypothetical protein
MAGALVQHFLILRGSHMTATQNEKVLRKCKTKSGLEQAIDQKL